MQVLGLPLSCFVLLLVTKLAVGLSEQTCTLELDCISQGWIGDPPSFRMFTLSAISDAIGEPVNR